MIIELYGLPATGKTTAAQTFAREGAVLIERPRGLTLIARSMEYCVLHPISAFGQLWHLLRYGHPNVRYQLFKSLFLSHAAKWQRACAVSRSGRVAVLDQGHHQNLLSLFGSEPSDTGLRSYARTLPSPDVLLVLTASAAEREERLASREATTKETEERRAIASSVFVQTLPLLKNLGVPVLEYSEGESLAQVLSRNISYVTIARMPTEKAHGISIAQLLSKLSSFGAKATLVIPSRKNPNKESIAAYYGVPDTFSVQTISSPDFIGGGMRQPAFFFLQRLMFASRAKRKGVAPGTIYTREPEIVATFARTHRTVYEAHRWPKGLAGWVTGRLLRSVALVVCNSRGTEAAVRRAGITRTLVAPNGFDDQMFSSVEEKGVARSRLGISSDLPVVLYIGLLSKGKGVHTLFAAAEHLKNEACVVVIGGSDKEVEALRKIYPAVQFLGYRPYTELANNLAAADVLVLPNTLTDTESAAYTSPIKLFGYMASGIPIVASAVPSVQEILAPDEAWLVSPDSPEALAGGIREALKKTSESALMGERAKVHSRDYTWHTRATRIYSGLKTTL